MKDRRETDFARYPERDCIGCVFTKLTYRRTGTTRYAKPVRNFSSSNDLDASILWMKTSY